MPIPVTFSPPGDSFVPSIEDALQFGAWLMFRADDVMRKRYSYDDNLLEGGRIVQRKVEIDPTDQRIVIPQLIISVAFPEVGFQFATSSAGTKKIVIAAMHLFPYETSYAESDLDAATMETVLMVLARSEELFMRGTLYRPDLEANDNGGTIIDPYRSPLYDEDDAPEPEFIGCYNRATRVSLNEHRPVVSRLAPAFWLRRAVKSESEINAKNDLAVAYGVKATYEVLVPDFKDMTTGGTIG